MIPLAIAAVERLPLPDGVTRAGVAWLVDRTCRRLAVADREAEARFVREMAAYPIAEHAADANAQHYELPSAFFELFLGPRRKYSCCQFDGDDATLAMAEQAALETVVERAELADGQSILELGCGWGSLSLHMAERFPAARITAVSNSASQRAFIEGRAAEAGLRNLRVVTADMNYFDIGTRHDRIVSIEMFEHMANWQALLGRARGWIEADGRLFLHVFTHRASSYRFDHRNAADWIARHFFTGGIMPSQGLARAFPQLFEVEAEWRLSGRHYELTALAWLAEFDRNRGRIAVILEDVYGRKARLWERRWRLFLLATAGLFGHAGGGEWGVGHYRMAPRALGD